MELNDLFDKKTLEAILADAAEAGIDADDVKKVLGTLPNGGKAQPSRSANPEGELMSLMGDDKEAVTDAVADAAGVERGKTGTILMLAAPFLLKYLFSNNSSSSSSGSLLGSLLGGGTQQQSASSMGGLDTMAALMSMMGGAQQQTSQTSLLGSLLGTTQTQPAYSTNSTASLLGSLMGMGGAQQTQQQSSAMDMGSLLNLMGSTQQTQPQTQQSSQSAGGGLLNALFNLLGDNG